LFGFPLIVFERFEIGWREANGFALGTVAYHGVRDAAGRDMTLQGLSRNTKSLGGFAGL
jgi:hypothetical protein